jgi:integrase
MVLHRVGAELLLITLTLWLQSAGVAALIAWVRRALGSDTRKIGTLRSAALVVRLAMAVVVLHASEMLPSRRSAGQVEGTLLISRPEDWVFASRHSRGVKPYWGQAILQKTRFGWHTFRHTYSTLLRSVGTEFKVMQELLGHSTIRSTLDVYTQAITPAKQNAQAAVMSLVFSSQ